MTEPQEHTNGYTKEGQSTIIVFEEKSSSITGTAEAFTAVNQNNVIADFDDDDEDEDDDSGPEWNWGQPRAPLKSSVGGVKAKKDDKKDSSKKDDKKDSSKSTKADKSSSSGSSKSKAAK